MPAGTRPHPLALLRRAALLASLLALIAGFLGMHILSDPHSLHSGAGSTQANGSTETLRSTHSHDGPLPSEARNLGTTSVTLGGTPVPPSCVCSDGCSEKPAAHPDCTPSPAGASLNAPQPGTALLATQPLATARADRNPDYAYQPASPTPRELSISRT